MTKNRHPVLGKQGFISKFCKNKLAVIGVCVLFVILVLCIGAPLFTEYDPILDMVPQERLKLPGTIGHLLGTDDYGRDIFSRLLYGGRTSIFTGMAVAILSALLGVFVGCVSGYFSGILDAILMRFTDIMLSFPFLIIAISLMSVLGTSQKNVIFALALISWPQFARLARSCVLEIKEQTHVAAAKSIGFSNCRILFFHILPNAMGPIIAQLTLAVGNTILSAASLTFLGMTTDSTLPDWGGMLNQGRAYMQTYPHLTLIPGIAISLTVLAINWIGDGIQEALNAGLKR